MTTVFAGSTRPRQTFLVVGIASRVVSMRFYSGMVRSVEATFLSSATMTDETSMQAFVVAISRASLSHLNETSGRYRQ
jgi:hypothetical protein